MAHTASRRKPDLTRALTEAELAKIRRRSESRRRKELERGTEFPDPSEDVELTEPANFVHPTKRRSQ